jgi:hypothetical protein
MEGAKIGLADKEKSRDFLNLAHDLADVLVASGEPDNICISAMLALCGSRIARLSEGDPKDFEDSLNTLMEYLRTVAKQEFKEHEALRRVRAN